MKRYKSLFKEMFVNSTVNSKSGKYVLKAWHGSGNRTGYTLNINIPFRGMLKNVPEDDFLETDNYFYAEISKNPSIFDFVSQSTGGAIRFKGAGRWSGNAEDFGNDIGIPMSDVVVNNVAGYAIPVSELEQIMKTEFPEVDYTLGKYNEVEIEWQ